MVYLGSAFSSAFSAAFSAALHDAFRLPLFTENLTK